MKISGKRDYLVSLESVAMTDIVLNMFIFFFISFSLLYTFSSGRMKKLGINLPDAKKGEDITAKRQLNISVNNKGVIYVEKEAVTLEELVDNVEAVCAKNPEVGVVLHADKSAQFKYIAKVLDVLSGLHIKNINIAVTALDRR
ncbi:MAG: biopolymer transporter ExbD [Candidatus Omnitrophota bacterium]